MTRYRLDAGPHPVDEHMVARNRFGTCAISQEGIGFEMRLAKPS